MSSAHELIDKLANELQPVRPVRSPALTGFAMASLLLLWTIFLVKLFFNLRTQTADLWQLSIYIINATLLCLMTLFGGALLGLEAVPGSQRRFLRHGLANAAGFLFLYLLLMGVPQAPAALVSQPGAGLTCTIDVLLLSLLPAALGLVFLKRGATIHASRSSLILALVSTAIGALALPLSCESSAPWHLLVSHLLLPAAVVGAIMLPLGRRVLKF